MHPQALPTLTIIIKALNEEDNIEACIKSVLTCMSQHSLRHEIILADSFSDDNTINIAKQYPINIVQLFSKSDRSCGAGAQIGYQYSKGDFILLIDGDMTLSSNFLDHALNKLISDHSLAGIGGLIVDKHIETYAERKRNKIYSSISSPIDVSALGGGGLYRRACLERVGYFSHSGLAACEELELGVRLKASGYRLQRIPIPFTFHSSHRETPFECINRMWRSGRFAAYGTFLRYSFDKPWLCLAIRECWFLLPVPSTAIIAFAAYIITSKVFLGFSTFILLWFLLGITLSFRKKSVDEALWSLIHWWIFFIAAIPPILQLKAKEPNMNVNYRIIEGNFRL